MTAAVTVVVPTRNRVSLLLPSLRSILDQTAVELEVVVVDDHSTDGTADAVRALDDGRVRVVPSTGMANLAAARNTGVASVRTEWVAFCDDDDLWAPEKLAAQLDALSALADAAWCATGAVFVDDGLGVLGPALHPPPAGDVADLLLARNAIAAGASTVLARTDLVREVGGFDTSLGSCEDWDLWIRLSLRAQLATVDQPVVAYRRHAGGLAHRVALMEQALTTLERRYAVERSRRAVVVAWPSWMKYMASSSLRAGHPITAARLHARLARHHGVRRAWLWAAAGLVDPRYQQRRDAADAAGVPPAWRAEAEGWLAGLRRATGQPVTTVSGGQP